MMICKIHSIYLGSSICHKIKCKGPCLLSCIILARLLATQLLLSFRLLAFSFLPSSNRAAKHSLRLPGSLGVIYLWSRSFSSSHPFTHFSPFFRIDINNNGYSTFYSLHGWLKKCRCSRPFWMLQKTKRSNNSAHIILKLLIYWISVCRYLCVGWVGACWKTGEGDAWG